MEKTLHQQLQQHINSLKWESAKGVAYEMLESQPESSWLHTSLGKILYHLREYQHAETHLKTAIYHHDNHAEAHAYLGHVYLGMNHPRIGSAGDCANKAISLDGSNILAWSLLFNVKLAYSDLPAARDCYAKLKQLGAEQGLLSVLNFNLIRHPANKEPVDFEAEIKTRKEQLETKPENHITHAQLAYLYNRFTNKSDLAEHHIHQAVSNDPTSVTDPQIQETSMLIQRKKNFWLRILTAPAQSIIRPTQIDKNEVAAVGIAMISLITFATFGNQHPWMIRAGIFGLIALFFCSYTANLAFQYLVRTENYHRTNQTSLLKEPFLQIHLLPFKKRTPIIISLTLLSWIILGLFLYFLTR